MIDFDKIFENYLVEWYKEHEHEFENVEDMEDKLPDIYNEWADTPSASLGNIAPRAFFANITSPHELVTLLIGTSAGQLNPCSLLLDRIVEVKECRDGLEKILTGSYNTKQKMLAANLLGEIGGDVPLEVYISWIADEKSDKELRELAVEILAASADKVAETLYPLLEGANEELKTDIAEILVGAKKDDRTYELLVDLFATGNNVPLFAAYLGKYGDERAAEVLYKALDEANYLEYIEIKNAIERLGGVVEDTKDFSSDEYYKALKDTE